MSAPAAGDGDAHEILRGVYFLIDSAVDGAVRGGRPGWRWAADAETSRRWGEACGDLEALIVAVADRLGVVRNRDDLYQAARDSLLDAVRRYDGRPATTMRTYAYQVIRRRMKEEMTRLGLAVRVPPTSMKRARSRARLRALGRCGVGPESDTDRAALRAAESCPFDPRRHDRVDPRAADPAELAAARERVGRVRAAVRALPRPHRRVLEAVFGLAGADPVTPRDYARARRLRPEAVARLVDEAMGMLRVALQEGEMA